MENRDKLNKLIIPALIVVEGQSDINKLKNICEADFIATNGTEISSEVLNTIKLAGNKKRILVLTDPDYPGKKIRNIINDYLRNKCDHAFIQREYCRGKRKIGVAEANIEHIRNVLKSYLSKINDDKKNHQYPSIRYSNYKNLDLNNKSIRRFICHKIGIDYYNNKGLFKMLNLLKITESEIIELREEYFELNK